MPSYRFLSDEWIAAARAIRDDHTEEPDGSVAPVRMNLVVEEMPFGERTLDAHIDTTSGRFDIGTGHLDNPEVTVRLNYGLAKSILVDGDGRAAIGAFFTRRLKIDGDMSKLMAFQSTAPGPRQQAVTEAIRAMTA